MFYLPTQFHSNHHHAIKPQCLCSNCNEINIKVLIKSFGAYKKKKTWSWSNIASLIIQLRESPITKRPHNLCSMDTIAMRKISPCAKCHILLECVWCIFYWLWNCGWLFIVKSIPVCIWSTIWTISLLGSAFNSEPISYKTP